MIPFFKFHALGNDFVLLDWVESIPALTAKKTLIRQMSCRKTGIGCDQWVLLKESKYSNAKAKVLFYNADGSRAEMCGNAMRAVGLYLFLKYHEKKKRFIVETDCGLRSIEWIQSLSKSKGHPGGRSHGFFRCAMGVPHLFKPSLGVSLQKHLPICVNVGNPHAVFFMKPKNEAEFLRWGSGIEHHPAFPNRTNVEFVQVINPSHLDVLVWERGVGPTEACGSGAVAVAKAWAMKNSKAHSRIKLSFPGGQCHVSFDEKQEAFLEGEAELAFRGQYFY